MANQLKGYSHFRKVIAAFIAVSLLFPQSVSASSLSNPNQQVEIQPFVIPEKFGEIEESLVGNSNKTIIYIQDAHDSLEAQENIAKIIHYLVDKYNVKTVYEEGYEGPVPTDKYFGTIRDPKIREKVAYFLMDKLRIGGAEYAHITRAKDFKLIGADNLRLHKKNIEKYQNSARYRKETEKDLAAMDAVIRRLAKQYFPKNFKEWMVLKERLDRQEIDLLDYLRRIRFSHLEESLKSKDAKTLFEEINRFEDDFAKRYLKERHDREIFRYYKLIQILKRLNAIEITEEEYEAVKENLNSVDTEKIAQFIVAQNHKSLVLSKTWESHIKNAIGFYEIAQKRDASIRNRLEEYRKSGRKEPAVLVYGGFHKRNIKELLNKSGLSYNIVTPKITSVSPRHLEYYKQLMQMGYDNIALPNLVAKATRAPDLLAFGVGGPKSEARVHGLISQVEEILSTGKNLAEMDLAWANRRSEVRKLEIEDYLTVPQQVTASIIESTGLWVMERMLFMKQVSKDQRVSMSRVLLIGPSLSQVSTALEDFPHAQINVVNVMRKPLEEQLREYQNHTEASRLRLIWADASQLQAVFEDNYFDLVLATGSVDPSSIYRDSQRPAKDIFEDMYREEYRIVKPGGYIFHSIGLGSSPFLMQSLREGSMIQIGDSFHAAVLQKVLAKMSRPEGNGLVTRSEVRLGLAGAFDPEVHQRMLNELKSAKYLTHEEFFNLKYHPDTNYLGRTEFLDRMKYALAEGLAKASDVTFENIKKAFSSDWRNEILQSKTYSEMEDLYKKIQAAVKDSTTDTDLQDAAMRTFGFYMTSIWKELIEVRRDQSEASLRPSDSLNAALSHVYEFMEAYHRRQMLLEGKWYNKFHLFSEDGSKINIALLQRQLLGQRGEFYISGSAWDNQDESGFTDLAKIGDLDIHYYGDLNNRSMNLYAAQSPVHYLFSGQLYEMYYSNEEWGSDAEGPYLKSPAEAGLYSLELNRPISLQLIVSPGHKNAGFYEAKNYMQAFWSFLSTFYKVLDGNIKATITDYDEWWKEISVQDQETVNTVRRRAIRRFREIERFFGDRLGNTEESENLIRRIDVITVDETNTDKGMQLMLDILKSKRFEQMALLMKDVLKDINYPLTWQSIDPSIVDSYSKALNEFISILIKKRKQQELRLGIDRASRSEVRNQEMAVTVPRTLQAEKYKPMNQSTRITANNPVVFVDGSAKYEKVQDRAKELAVLAASDPKRTIVIYNSEKIGRLTKLLKSFELRNIKFVPATLSEAIKPYQFRANVDLIHYSANKEEAAFVGVSTTGWLVDRLKRFVGNAGALKYALKHLEAVKLNHPVEDITPENGYFAVAPRAALSERLRSEMRFVTVFAQAA